MEPGHGEEMQQPHAGESVPGVPVKLPPISQKQRMQDGARIGIRQKTIQAGLYECAGGFKDTSDAPSVLSRPLQTSFGEIQTGIHALAKQIFSIIELAGVASLGQCGETAPHQNPIATRRTRVQRSGKPPGRQQSDRIAISFPVQPEHEANRSRIPRRIVENAPFPHGFLAARKRFEQRMILGQGIKRSVSQSPETYRQRKARHHREQRAKPPRRSTTGGCSE